MARSKLLSRKWARSLFVPLLSVALIGGTGASIVLGQATAQAATQLPCDIYAAAGNTCDAAYSTTRALFSVYSGKLYQIQRASDGAHLDISTASPGGIANASGQQSFCSGTSCTITMLYDQSGNGNNLPISDGGGFSGAGPNGTDAGANAMADPIVVGGHPAYGVKITPGLGYRTPTGVDAKGVPTGDQPIGIYALTSSNFYDGICCMDFGLGEVSHRAEGDGTMNAIEWGSACWTGGCTGPGPWVQADLENGMYMSNTGPNPRSTQGISYPFVSAWEKNNGTTNFTLKYGDANSGGLTTEYSGSLPNGYNPMHMEPDILLGVGGDNSDWDNGLFYEGAILSGYPSDATENAVQAELTTVGFAGGSATEAPYGGTPAAVPGTVQAANYDTGGQGVAYNVNAVNGTGNNYRSDGVDLETCSNDTACGDDIGWTTPDQWFRYTVNVATAGTYQVALRVASPNGVNYTTCAYQQPCGGALHISNTSGANLSGYVNIPATGGYQNWTTVTANVTLPAGVQTLVVNEDNGGWNLHSMSLTTSTTTGGSFPTGYHTLVVANDGLCADGYGNTSNAGAIIDQWACNGQTNQRFQFVATSSGYGELQIENSGQDVAVLNASTAQGTPDIVQEPVSGSTASQWLPQQQSDGSWQFKNRNSGLCLDVYGAGSNQGQQFDQWPCKNAPGTNQDFTAK